MIQVYNTLGRARVPLEPREPGKVSMYVCGPTVQSAPHVGHGRSAVAFAAAGPPRPASDLGVSVVLVSGQDGPAGRLFFAPATALPTEFVAPYQTHIRKQGGEYTLHLTDFREVEGLRVPFAMNRDDEAERSTRWSFSTYTLTPAIVPTDSAPPIR